MATISFNNVEGTRRAIEKLKEKRKDGKDRANRDSVNNVGDSKKDEKEASDSNGV